MNSDNNSLNPSKAKASFWQLPNKGQVCNAALLAFFAGLPMSFGNLVIITYFHSFVLLFTLSGLWLFRHQAPSFIATMKQRSPISFYLFIAWWLMVTASWLNTLSNDISGFHIFATTQRYLHDLMTIGFTFTAARLLMLGHIQLTHIITALSIGMIGLISLYFYTYHSYTIAPLTWFGQPPLAPHIRDLGNLACVCIVGLTSLLLNTRNQSPTQLLAYGFLLIANWAFLLWTGGRMGMAAAGISSLVLGGYFMFYRQTQLKRLCLIALCIVMAGIIAKQSAVFEWNGFARNISNVQESTASQETKASSSNNAINLNNLTTGRTQMWAMSLNAVKASPWLGLGPFGYFFIPERTYDDQPHNFIVQFLVEWGLLGSLPIFALLLLCAYQAIKRLPQCIKNNDANYICGAAIVLVLSIHGLTGGTYFKIQPFICLALGFAVFLIPPKKP